MKNTFIISGVVLSILLFLIIHSCKKEKPIPPVITTASITEITQTTATSGGDLIEISGSSILSKGVCWNISPNPTVDNAMTTESGVLGSFVSKITQLTPNTLYYVRAYAISNVVTGYGNQVSFTTSQLGIPGLTTAAITSITQTSAVSGGIITSDGGQTVTSRGVCWNTSPNPTTTNNKTSDEIFPPLPPGIGGTGTGSFISSLTNLQAGTKYYVRSYAVNSLGTAYGNELDFITSAEIPGVPTLTTSAITSSSPTSASSGGNISKDGGSAVTERGICWSTTTNPTTANFKTSDGTGTGIFTSNMTVLIGNTTYYVRAYATNSSGTGYGNELNFTTSPVAAVVPTLITTAATSVTTTTATSGGNISNDGGASISAKGVCWGTATDPTTAGSKTSDGTGTGIFTSSITGLVPNTTYYVRAYATNSAGTAYGSSLSFKTEQASGLTVTDPDGNVYHTKTIGTQVWMVENLMTTKLNDNTSIPLVTDATAWGDLETPGYCFPGNDVNNKATYGMLYNWYAVNTGKLCPTGWHVPTDAEWTTLTTYLGGESIAGGKLKEAGISHWLTPNTGATNESGFTALPGADRMFNGTFTTIGVGGYWWTSTQHSEGFSWYRYMYYLLAYVDRDYHGKEYGSSIRCIEGVGKVVPIVTTSDVTAITSTTATGGGNVTSDGGATVTARGVCWNTSLRPTTDNSKTNNGTGIGSFISSLTGLTANTKYYIRAYATNSEGTVYGSETNFTTSAASAAIPVLSTTAISGITQTTANSGGNITSDGGALVTARGVCWSTSANPTIALSTKTSNGTGTGSYTSNITGLTANTNYYVRAYATNSVGTAYGNELIFTTGSLIPTLTTTAISSITSTTASSGGNITSDGGASVTARGVCWNTSASPTIALSTKTTDGSGTGNFTSSLTGLTPGATYYVRSYATNSAGTAYGNELSFSAGAVIPTLSSTAVSSISATTASSGGNITNDGGSSVTARGVCWNTSTNPTIGLSTKTTDGSGTGSFTSSLTGLTPSTTYYVRAYATNGVGTAYGDEKSFTTIAAVSTLTTEAITSITTTTASSGGNITNDGGASVSVRGVCWSTSASPTTANSKTTDGSGSGSFVSSLAGLTPGATYYVRAYATNSAGTAYGNQLSFTTNALIPTLTTTSISSITSTTASSGGNISSDGGATVSVRGVCWSTSANPTTANNTTSNGTGTGSFISSLTGLTGNTTYYVRAYATNSAGTAYGNELSFTTSPLVPTLITEAITSITSTTASSGGNISNDGGASVTVRGVCWSTVTNPTIALGTKTSDGSGTGGFSSSITGLTPGTTYYVRAYATNSAGTAYGSQLSFNTSAVIPTLTTTAIGSITATTASSGGNITNDGGASVSVRGVCWSTSTNPTTALGTKTTDGSGTGSFTSSLTGLTGNTAYYVRAYATNSAGTAYGDEVSFITSPVIPTLSTTVISSITQTSASSGGNITNDGGASVTVRGVCWSTTTNPNTSNSKTTDGSGTGGFVSSITGLTGNTTYYVRAYATNSAGTAYGNQLTFTSSPLVATLTTTAISSITYTTASSGGNITSDGGASVSARGVCWNTGGNPTTTDSKTTDGSGTGSFTSALTGLTANTIYYVRAYATSTAGIAYGNEVSFTTIGPLVVPHTAGSVAPVTKTVTYQTAMTTLSGANKLWITQNLGATNEAGSATDATEASAGWYWQFNRSQGYKHDGATRTPGSAWLTTLPPAGNWSAGNDPCALLLGSGWRIPTETEWTNADATGGWSNYGQTFASVLKLHAAGNLYATDGSLVNRGTEGMYWSNTAYGTSNAGLLDITSSGCNFGSNSNRHGMTVRCIKD
jgi:uncharacterized protein (TIGR02145 family)